MNIPQTCKLTVTLLVAICFPAAILMGDGKVIRPRNYKGSLEEKSQEAIIIFNGGEKRGDAIEDLILKITVAGEARNFAWVIPFPSEPIVKKEDPKLFAELFKYVELRRSRPARKFKSGGLGTDAKNDAEAPKVKVLSRKVVGDFEIVTVKETQEGGLNPWLEKEGFQKLEDAEDVIGFYRKKDYVFCCIKVRSESLATEKKIDSHPLRFTFKTGGQDGIYFPMKMTGLQQDHFDINLYVFYRFWINDKLNKFGYQNRGFELAFRDYDTKECEANGGKAYSLPSSDPYLKFYARHIPTVTRLFQKLHPGKKYYLTNIKARNLDPEDVREWSDDLWVFPYYTDRTVVPYDVQDNGPAAGAWPDENASSQNADLLQSFLPGGLGARLSRYRWLIGASAMIVLLVAAYFIWNRHSGATKADVPWKKFD